MRRVALLLFALLILFSCKKEEISLITHKLKNCRIEYLFFEDDLMMTGDNSFSFLPDSQNIRCNYLYADNKMIKSIGGFLSIPTGTVVSNQLFSYDFYDSISTIDRTIYVYTKFKLNGSLLEAVFNPTIFYLDSHEKLVKITKIGALGSPIDLNYTYTENQIDETFSSGKARRKFYFEKNNLVKVVTEIYDLKGLLNSKKEILFQEFDDKPNPFRNMYFVKGAFFRAFSDNNYKSYTTNLYYRSSDGTLTLTNRSWSSMPILYNTDGYPLFGDYE